MTPPDSATPQQAAAILPALRGGERGGLVEQLAAGAAGAVLALAVLVVHVDGDELLVRASAVRKGQGRRKLAPWEARCVHLALGLETRAARSGFGFAAFFVFVFFLFLFFCTQAAAPGFLMKLPSEARVFETCLLAKGNPPSEKKFSGPLCAMAGMPLFSHAGC